MTTVLIAGEATPEGASPQMFELVVAARSITGDGGDIVAAFVGAPGMQAPPVPVDRIYTVEHEALGEPDSATFDAATDALHALIDETKPDFVLLTRSDIGVVAAPRVARRLGTAFARDCMSIEASDGAVSVTRPVHGGNANARYRLNGGGPHIIMVRPGVYEPVAAADSAPETVSFDPTPHIREGRSTLIRTVQEAHEGVRLEDAEVVVSGGRGLGGPEPFKQLAELAELLGGALGASRAACDAGWIDHSHQVGLTGKSVSPRLYLTFGISGASQHMAGCSSARNIVAVNTDPDASIFGDARFGVVGDWNKVLPALISAVRDIG